MTNKKYGCKVNGMGNDIDTSITNSKEPITNGSERRRRRKNVIPPTAVKMLSIREIACRYDFHENTVRRWVTVDGLKCVRYGPGRKIYISEKDVEKFHRKYYY